jgi:hypothetical protein
VDLVQVMKQRQIILLTASVRLAQHEDEELPGSKPLLHTAECCCCSTVTTGLDSPSEPRAFRQLAKTFTKDGGYVETLHQRFPVC